MKKPGNEEVVDVLRTVKRTINYDKDHDSQMFWNGYWAGIGTIFAIGFGILMLVASKGR